VKLVRSSIGEAGGATGGSSVLVSSSFHVSIRAPSPPLPLPRRWAALGNGTAAPHLYGQSQRGTCQREFRNARLQTSPRFTAPINESRDFLRQISVTALNSLPPPVASFFATPPHSSPFPPSSLAPFTFHIFVSSFCSPSFLFFPFLFFSFLFFSFLFKFLISPGNSFNGYGD
jgi:hypothetical protein